MTDQLSRDISSLRLDRKRKSKRGSRRGLAIGLVVAAALGVGVVGARYLPNDLVAETLPPVALGTITKSVPEEGQKRLTASGYVVAQEETKLNAGSSGRVIEAAVSKGDVVAKGDLLLRLDATDEKSAAHAAAAKVDVAHARAAEAKARLDQIEQQIERQQVLVDKNVKGHAVVDDLEGQAKSERRRYEAALAESKAAAADANAHAVRLRGSRLESPIAGTIVSRVPRVGEMVGPSGPAIEIVDFASLVVETDVPEGKLHLVDEPGTTCEVLLEAYPDRRYPCKTDSVGTHVDRAKATVPVRVVFTADTDRVLPNMSASVTFFDEPGQEKAREEQLLVPAAAVVERDGKQLVFTVATGGVATAQPVVIGERAGSSYILEKGPPAGSRVVLDPATELRDGMVVSTADD